MDIVPEITHTLEKPTCIMGVGNSIRRDDGVGVYILEELEKLMEKAVCAHISTINAEDVPENYAFRVAGMDCENVLVIDAIAAGLRPGDVVFGSLEESGRDRDCSTHKLSLGLAAKIWKESGKSCYLLGIQAGDTGFGAGMTDAVKKTAEMIVTAIIRSITSIPEGVNV